MYYTHLHTSSNGRIDGLTYFFIHSGYYISFRPNCKYAYFLVNLYPELEDTKQYPFNNGEGFWYRRDGIIYTKVDGNESIYRHPDFSLGGQTVHTLDDLPSYVIVDSRDARIKYHVEVLASVKYQYNTEVAIKLSMVPFNCQQPEQSNFYTQSSEVTPVQKKNITMLELLGVSPLEEIREFNISSPYPLVNNKVYSFSNKNGEKVLYYNNQIVMYDTLSNKYYNKVVQASTVEREYNYYIGNLADALSKSDEQAYHKLKLEQFKKFPGIDMDEYKDLMVICDFLAAKLYVESKKNYYVGANYLRYCIDTLVSMILIAYYVIIAIMLFYVFRYDLMDDQITLPLDFLISPVTHLLDGKVSLYPVFQHLTARLLLFRTFYKWYIMNPRNIVKISSFYILLEVMAYNTSWVITLLTQVEFIMTISMFLIYKLGSVQNYAKKHAFYIILYVLVQIIVPSSAHPLLEYYTSCSQQGFNKISVDLIKHVISFYKSVKFLYEKPCLAFYYKDNDYYKEKSCNFNKHRACHVTQIIPNVKGFFNQNIPIQLHQCPITSLSATTRNMIKRADYDIRVVDSFKRFIDTKYSKIDYYFVDEFFHKYQPITVEEFLKSNYTSSQLNEYLDAYSKLTYLNKPVQLSLMKSHVKVDELQYLTEVPKDRNITAQDSCSKVIMSYITHLSAQIYKKNDYGYSSGLNFTQREQRMQFMISHFSDPVEIDIDGSGYDSTQYDILKTIVDVPIYLYILKHLNKFELNVGAAAHILINQLQNVYNKVVHNRYMVKGTVASGMMSTSDGNTRRSLSYIRFGLRTLKEGIDYFVEALGDDVKIICNRSKADSIVRLLKDNVYVNGLHNNLGQIAKYINVVNLDQGNFISTTTLVKNGEVKFLRQFDRVLSSFAYSIKCVNFTSDISRMYKVFLLNISKYYSIMDWCKGVEFYEKLAKYHLRYAKFLAV